jgi:hypothetical protein
VHEYSRQLFDQDEYHGDFDDLVHDKIDVDWYYSSICDIYFRDNCVDNYIVYSDNNGNNDIINDILINNLNTKCKENMKGAQ